MGLNMRSSEAPRVRHDATVRLQTGALGAAFDARSVNLSVGGVFVEADKVLDPGAQVEMKVNLADGGSPLETRGEVVWVRPQNDDHAKPGMAVRFLALDEVGARRIARLVASRVREPTGMLKRKVRIKLAGLPAALRAVARDLNEHGVMLEAELPWLKLGSAVETEISQGRSRVGRLRWVGVDVASSGVARLRISVDFVDGAAAAGTPAASDAPVQPVHEPDETEMIDMQPPKRRFWAWAILLVLAGVATAGALWLDRMSSVRPIEGAELRVTDTLPPPETPPPSGVVIPKTKGAAPAPAATPHKRGRH